MKQPSTLREYVAKLVHQSHNPSSKEMKTGAANKIVSILFSLVMLPIIVSAGVLAKEAVNKLMNRDRLTERAPVPQPWLRYQLSGVGVDSPLAFVRDSNLEQLTIAPYKERYEAIEIYRTPLDRDDCLIVVSHGIIKPDFTYDLDLGVAAIVRMAAAEVGDHNPQYTSTPVRVSGLNARLVAYKGKDVVYDMLMVATTNDHWQVGVAANPRHSNPDLTSRIINSMTVTP